MRIVAVGQCIFLCCCHNFCNRAKIVCLIRVDTDYLLHGLLKWELMIQRIFVSQSVDQTWDFFYPLCKKEKNKSDLSLKGIQKQGSCRLLNAAWTFSCGWQEIRKVQKKRSLCWHCLERWATFLIFWEGGGEKRQGKKGVLWCLNPSLGSHWSDCKVCVNLLWLLV